MSVCVCALLLVPPASPSLLLGDLFWAALKVNMSELCPGPHVLVSAVLLRGSVESVLLRCPEDAHHPGRSGCAHQRRHHPPLGVGHLPTCSRRPQDAAALVPGSPQRHRLFTVSMAKPDSSEGDGGHGFEPSRESNILLSQEKTERLKNLKDNQVDPQQRQRRSPAHLAKTNNSKLEEKPRPPGKNQ